MAIAGTAGRVQADEPAAKAESKTKLQSPLAWPVGKIVFQESDDVLKMRALLEQPAEVQYLDTPLGDVVTNLEERYKINFELDMEALAADGKGSDLPITKTLKRVTLDASLRLILEGQGLTYLIKHGVVLITTKTAASAPENLSTRLYQVHDLVVAPNDLTAQRPNFDSLIELLTNTIRQQDWQDNGGTVGFIHSFHGPGILAITVTHDEQGHREIEQLLKMLRASRMDQIVEAQKQQPLEPAKSGLPASMGGLSGGAGTAAARTPPPARPGVGFAGFSGGGGGVF
jgi:hypothetical protein